MAEYFKLSLSEQEGIIQTDKSAFKKSFYNFNFKILLSTDPDAGDEVNNFTTSLSLPINSDHFVLQNISISKKISYVVDGAAISIFFTTNGGQNFSIPTPGMTENLKLGFSDAAINTAFTYQAQNMIHLPFSFADRDFQNEQTIHYNHRFLFKKNVNWLNCILRLATWNTGDIVNVMTFLDTYYPQGYTAGGIYYQYNILVSGIMDK